MPSIRASRAHVVPGFELGRKWVALWSLLAVSLSRKMRRNAERLFCAVQKGWKDVVLQWFSGERINPSHTPTHHHEKELRGQRRSRTWNMNFLELLRRDGFPEPFPRWLWAPPAWLSRDEGRPHREGPRWGCLPGPHLRLQPRARAGPPHSGFGLWLSAEDRAPADWPCLGELAVLQGWGGCWRWFPLWESLGSPNAGYCQNFGSSDGVPDTCCLQNHHSAWVLMLLSSCSLGECATNTAFDHLKKYLEVVKSCLFEVHTVYHGCWWGRGTCRVSGGATAAKVITACLGRFNLHCKRFYSILFAFLNILYYFSVNLNSSYVYGAYGDAVNFLLPWGFQTASFSKLFRKLFNHLGKSKPKNLVFTYYSVVNLWCKT